MTPTDQQKFAKLLLHKRNQLQSLEQTADSAAETVELDQSKVGRLSRMDALQAQAMSVETRRRRDIELTKINAALNRINDGDYGYCLSCGEDINPQRLHIDPAASQCIQCADKHNNDKL